MRLGVMIVLVLVLLACHSWAQNLPYGHDDCPPGTHWSDGRCKSSVRIRFGPAQTDYNKLEPAASPTSASPFVTSARPPVQPTASLLPVKKQCPPGYVMKLGTCKPSYIHPYQWLPFAHQPFYGSSSLNKCFNGHAYPHFHNPFTSIWNNGHNSWPLNNYWGYPTYGGLHPYQHHPLSNICPPGYYIFHGKCKLQS